MFMLARADLSLVAIGALGGIFSGLLGVGGGVVMVPLLVRVAGLSQHRAHATSLAAIVPLAAFGAATYALGAKVDVAVATALALGTVVGAPLGARLMVRASEGALKLAFGILQIVVALVLVADMPDATTTHAEGLSVPAAAALIGTGVVVGGFSALFGVGGGVIMVPVLTLAMQREQHVAEGTSLAVIVVAALVGALAHRRAGLLTRSDVLPLASGGAVGAVVGAALALAISGGALRVAFAAFLAVMAIDLIRGGVAGLRRAEARP